MSEATYNVPELEGLKEAREIINQFEVQAINLDPIWRKLFHAKEYIEKRQNEVLASVLAPEVEA